jgi:hypothetical protein
MFLFFTILIASCLLVLIAGRWLTRSSENTSFSIEALLAGDAVLDRYRPMQKLLRESDWHYLASQPGFTASRIRKFRAQRRAIFRGYLECMNGDFAGLCLLVRALMVQSAVDRPDLSSALFKIRLAYFGAVLKIQLLLMAQAAGVSSLQIDLSGVTGALEEMSACVRSMQLPAAASFA